MSELAVPLPSSLIAEAFVRSNGRADIANLIANVFEDFLDRTRGDPDIWSIEHAESVSEEEGDDFLRTFGSPTKGYHWQRVFLPNGTKLRMSYNGDWHYADVRDQFLHYADSTMSPSQFASRVANNTSRNAWRDIWVKRPSDREWTFADTLRRSI